ncbi:hypothetical protein JOF41_005800 [Saccharothrix coeruleofusca]|nr:hypothetical protein [Saccharothrix coeruleofusca]
MLSPKQAAEAGSFAISESGAQDCRKVINYAQDDFRKLDHRVRAHYLQQKTKSDTIPDSRSMSRYNLGSAAGGASILLAIDQLKAALADASAARRKAYGQLPRC